MKKYLIDELKNIIREAGKISLDFRKKGLKIERKEDGSPVTNADTEISTFIYNNLLRLAPEIPVICEERPIFDVDRNKSFWLIDPIDGTRSYINNKDSFTINIAMIEGGLPSYGFIYQPTTDRLYYTNENKQFCIEEKGQEVKRRAHSQNGYVAVVSSNSLNEKTSSYLKSNNFCEILSVPSSIKLCMIAEGVGDVYPKFGTTMEWDIAAGHALIRASGGEVTILGGSVMTYAKQDFRNNEFLAMSRQWVEKGNVKVVV